MEATNKMNENGNKGQREKEAIEKIAEGIKNGIRCSKSAYDNLTHGDDRYTDFNDFINSIAESVYNNGNSMEDGIRLVDDMIDYMKKYFFKRGISKDTTNSSGDKYIYQVNSYMGISEAEYNIILTTKEAAAKEVERLKNGCNLNGVKIFGMIYTLYADGNRYEPITEETIFFDNCND